MYLGLFSLVRAHPLCAKGLIHEICDHRGRRRYEYSSEHGKADSADAASCGLGGCRHFGYRLRCRRICGGAVSLYSAKVRGIESDKEKVRQFQQLHQDHTYMVDIASAEALPYPSDSFDIVIVNEVLEHIPNQDLALDEIHRVLKSDGRFLLFCPNRLYPFESHGMENKDRIISNPWIPFVPYFPLWSLKYFGLKPWARNYWPWEVNRLLKRHRFSINSKTYISQTFENISGRQPSKLSLIRPMLRRLFDILEKIPLIRMFTSVSQIIVSVPRANSRKLNG